MQESKFVVVPSEWYDNSPLVIYESFSMGKPVIATRLGGMPELIDDNINGYLFSPGDINQLTEKIRILWDNSDRWVGAHLGTILPGYESDPSVG